MKLKFVLILAGFVTASSAVAAETPIKEVLAQIDAATGKAKDTATEFTVSGLIAARLVLPDGNIIAFLHNPGEPALMLSTDAKGGADLVPRNAVKVAGKLGDGSFGAARALNPGSVSVSATNQPFGSELVTAKVFQNAGALLGRYVQLPNVTFTPGKFDATGKATIKTDAGELVLLVGKGVADQARPAVATDVFGMVVGTGAGWQLAAARFLPTARRQTQQLALTHTCLTCHNPDMKIIGPSYRDVAAKYRNDPEALPKLITQMENGGSGKWGPVAMIPFKGKVPPADMKALGEWILSYRWDMLLAE